MAAAGTRGFEQTDRAGGLQVRQECPEYSCGHAAVEIHTYITLPRRVLSMELKEEPPSCGLDALPSALTAAKGDRWSFCWGFFSVKFRLYSTEICRCLPFQIVRI